MSDALVKIMNLPCTGFDNDGEETVNREAAAAIVQELEARFTDLFNQLQAKADYWDRYESGCSSFARTSSDRDVEDTYQRAAAALRVILNGFLDITHN